MAEFDVFDVVGDGVESLGFVHHFVWWHKDKLGVVVDEVLDQPRTGD